MSTLKAKTAINKLLKGEILFHSVYDEKIEPVQMVDGQIKNPTTGQEWSFSDFTQFYKTKEDGDKDLLKKKKVAEKNYKAMWNAKEKMEKQKKDKQDKDALDRKNKEIKKLTPIMNELNKALGSHGFEFIMHTNDKHSPCPAIHMAKGDQGGPFGTVYEICREIYLTNYESKDGKEYINSGSCNRHNHKSKDVGELIDKIMTASIKEKISA